ncbi:aftiphilin isoform X2 [Hyperolius riggenbachi]|uniref:aftiphilin isoform X2 n=1 Tax=Hyperolius riggenbachi TaxID=752182 RepID=UPI0035A2FA2A
MELYSSSPPPLDIIADDDEEDEFGDFGRFSDVNNPGIGFTDFDAVNYPKSREDFIPSKHFLPIHDYTDNSVNNIASLTSVKASEGISEISTSKKGLSSGLESDANHETTQFNDAALENKGNSGETDIHLNSRINLSSDDDDDADVVSRSQNQIAGTCNGEKIQSLENLTNGFTVVDSANPQGLQDVDSVGHSKGCKSHSTDLKLDFSPPSPGDDFADFATFSSKDTVDLDDPEPQAHLGLHEGHTPSIKHSTKIDRSEDEIVSTPTEVLNDPISQGREDSHDLAPADLPLERDILAVDSVLPPHPGTAVLETSIPDSMHSTDTKRTPGLAQTMNEKVLWQCNDAMSITPDQSLNAKELALSSNAEIEDTTAGSLSQDQPECDSSFGDFDAATEESPPPLTDNSESSKTYFHAPLELVMNEADDDFCDFDEINGSLHEDLTATSEKLSLSDVAEEHSPEKSSEGTDEFSDFGNFVTLQKKEDWGAVQGSEFAAFSTADDPPQPPEWNAFGEDQGESSSWAAFEEQKTDCQAKSDDWQSFRTDVPSSTDDQVINTQNIDLPACHQTESNLVCEDPSFAFQHSLLGRLERVIQSSFPIPSVADMEETISPLDLLLCTEHQEEASTSKSSRSLHTVVLDIWNEVQDIHDAYGLKYQWGGSHSNKKLLCSLGIDTRNILYTGNKKQPVIVPMYAAGLGMLEPTKEPLKPLSAAEKIASIGQSSHLPPDDISSSDQFQESLPPVQFDWSSSGLTNPLDGVDPELYALTTSKVECSSASNKVTDAFARLMSTAETTSTSARKPRRDENLSDEAAKVIASLPDLSFMHAKVLMFPVSLTPSASSKVQED